MVIEALKERSTIEELARKHEIHPTQIATWKKAFLENASAVFDNGESKGAEEKQREEEEISSMRGSASLKCRTTD